MRFAPETLLVFLAASASISAWSRDQDSPAAGATASPSPRPSPSTSPTPRYKLIPYGFETARDRSTVPLLRFEDQAEVRSLEMNAAIARFFDNRDDKGSMLRGATPGGAPTLQDMGPYRPHVTPGLDLLGAALVAAKELRKRIEARKGMPPAEPSPSASPAPSPIPYSL